MFFAFNLKGISGQAMLLILPFRTSIRPWRTPYANYALILINAIIFSMEFHIVPQRGLAFRPWVAYFMLTPSELRLWQLVTYAFLHGDYLHIIGNMFFLYVFGNNVNDKLGNIGYLCLYIAGWHHPGPDRLQDIFRPLWQATHQGRRFQDWVQQLL